MSTIPMNVESLNRLTDDYCTMREAIEEARRCLALIGHVPRSANTWADRCRAADAVLARALVEVQTTQKADEK